MTPPMEMEAAGEATSAASPLGDDVRDAVVADANPRAMRTIVIRARADSAASRRCSLLRVLFLTIRVRVRLN